MKYLIFIYFLESNSILCENIPKKEQNTSKNDKNLRNPRFGDFYIILPLVLTYPHDLPVCFLTYLNCRDGVHLPLF